jgi:hypothetical protein
VDAIQKLTPDAQTQAAIKGAITDVGKAIGEQGAIVVAGFSQLMAVVNSVTDKLSNQQNQINQIPLDLYCVS